MSQGFEHIKVGAHREPDEVLYAGAVDAAAPSTASKGASGQPATGGAPAPGEPSGRRGAALEAPAPPDGSAQGAASAPSAPDGFRETTLDDIESSRMPPAQRVIIALAGLAVIAFLAWNLIGSA